MTILKQDIDRMSVATDCINILVGHDHFLNTSRVRLGQWDTIYSFGKIGFTVSVDRKEVKGLACSELVDLVRHRTIARLNDVLDEVIDAMDKLRGSRTVPTPPTELIQGL